MPDFRRASRMKPLGLHIQPGSVMPASTNTFVPRAATAVPCVVVFLLALMASSATVCRQELRLQDPGAPAGNVGARTIEQLPIDAALRSAVQEAVRARNYSRAETILAGKIEKNPKSPELLKVLGSIFFLDGKYLNTAIALKEAEAVSPLDN